jgi:hypothetical protein
MCVYVCIYSDIEDMHHGSYIEYIDIHTYSTRHSYTHIYTYMHIYMYIYITYRRRLKLWLKRR